MSKYLKLNQFLLAIAVLLIVGCSDSNTQEKPASKTPLIKKKASKLIAPGINQQYQLGESINFEVALKDENQLIDSVTLEVQQRKVAYTNSTFTWSPEQPRVGKPRIKLTVYFDGKKETHYPKVLILPEASPAQYTYRVINTFPHDPSAYTQGLFWHEGLLWESTGKEGASTMRKVDLKSGQPTKKIDLDPALFGEGAAILQDKIYQLTWTSQKGFVYDQNLNQTGEFRYPTEGWGITTLEENLIMSDGTHNLYIMEPNGFTEIDRLQVYDHEGEVSDLNELENVNGKIYANVYGKEYIAVIDPATGAVEATIDFEGIWTRDNTNNSLDYVLNGIAYDAEGDRLFVTGKYWSNLFEVELLLRGNQP
ncbi:MAG: glutaminyl-peptide cyclotransferase [Cytophagales bacterium]|nr:glutaminyl-peptide cyclotransferase [Cytophagales bacterium]